MLQPGGEPTAAPPRALASGSPPTAARSTQPRGRLCTGTCAGADGHRRHSPPPSGSFLHEKQSAGPTISYGGGGHGHPNRICIARSAGTPPKGGKDPACLPDTTVVVARRRRHAERRSSPEGVRISIALLYIMQIINSNLVRGGTGVHGTRPHSARTPGSRRHACDG